MAVRQVHVTIGGTPKSVAYVVPYSHAGGLELYPTGQPVVYEVPSYEVRVTGGSVYAAVRFGLQGKGTRPPPARRRCDAGLSQPRFCFPTWVVGYSPHSFAGGARAGAWRLLQGKGFLIHEGADASKGQVGGSLGCIEILDGEWNGFLDEIERLSTTTCLGLGATQKLKVTVEAASYPMAKLWT